MSEHMEGGSLAQDKLEKSGTLGEILDIAMCFERTASQFYSALRRRIGFSYRQLVTELAEEEERHYLMLKELSRRDDLREMLKGNLTLPILDAKFYDYLHIAILDGDADEQSILEHAIGREHAALEQYRTLARETPAGVLRNLFAYLASEESQHKRALERRWHSLFSIL